MACSRGIDLLYTAKFCDRVEDLEDDDDHAGNYDEEYGKDDVNWEDEHDREVEDGEQDGEKDEYNVLSALEATAAADEHSGWQSMRREYARMLKEEVRILRLKQKLTGEQLLHNKMYGRSRPLTATRNKGRS